VGGGQYHLAGLREFDSKVLKFRGTADFLAWIKERSHLFRGVTFGTMLHDRRSASTGWVPSSSAPTTPRASSTSTSTR
jgi:hypothetical protein